MDLSSAGVELIKHWERLRLIAYPDPATNGAPWTIGWGHTGDVRPGDTITQAEAERLFRSDVAETVVAVNMLIDNAKVPQHEFNALVSFAFNVGPDIDDDLLPEGLGDSTLLRLYRAGDVKGAAAEFMKWNRAGKPRRPMLGLTRRRVAEQAMFLGRDWHMALAAFDSDERIA